MDVVQSITTSLNNYVFTLSETISEEYNIPIEEILQIWCEQQNLSFPMTFGAMLKVSRKQKKVSMKKNEQQHENRESSKELITVPEPVEIKQEEEMEIQQKLNGVHISEEEEKVTENGEEDTVEAATSSRKNLCTYVFSRGAKKGSRCTIIAKCGTVCSKHKEKK